jgi:polysaccharide export outer membrane protein
MMPPASAPAPSAPSNPMNFPSMLEPLTGPIRVGDTVSVLVIGEPTLSGGTTVDADGTVTLPLAGQIKLQGLMPTKASETVARVLKAKKLLRNPQVTVSITARPVRTVLVSGALAGQGRQPIKEGARLSEILEPAGITQTSDLTKVDITRGDKKFTVNYLKYRTGDEDSPAVNPVLEDNDRIYVPTAVSPAGVAGFYGEVKLPQQVAITKGLTVGQALQQVGGVTEFGDRNGIFIERNGARIPVPYEEIVKGEISKDIPLQDKDRITVPSLEKPKAFTVAGAVNSANTYPLLPRTKTTLLEAIGRAGGPQDGARQNVIEVRRTADNGTVRTTKYNLEKAQDAGVEIQPNDYIFVPYRRQRQALDIPTVLGAVSGLWFLFGR